MDTKLQTENKGKKEIVSLLQNKQYKKALDFCDKILAKQPKDFTANFFSGLVYLQTKKPKQAKIYFEKAFKEDPNNVDCSYYLGIVKTQLNEHHQAIKDFQKVLVQQPENAKAHCYLAEAFIHFNDFTKAIEHFQSAIQLGYRHPIIYNNLGNALQQNLHFAEAINAYNYALRLNPNYAECYFNLGAALEKTQQLDEARDNYLRAIALAPDYLDAHDHIAKIYEKLNDPKNLAHHLSIAVKLNPNPTYYPLLTKAFLQINDYDNGVKYFKKIPLENKQYMGFVYQIMLVCRNNCMWQEFAHWLSFFYQKTKEFNQKKTPFYFTTFILFKLTPQEQLEFARNSVNNYYAHYAYVQDKFSFDRSPKQKLRIGYVTISTRNHPLNHLMMHFYTHHNRNQFEIFLYALHSKDNSTYSEYMPTTVDHYTEVVNQNELAIAKQIYQDKIDILVDLVGYEENGKPGIFALKPAPIQITYLNFPATSGASYIDYIMLDETVAPQSEQDCYAEKLIHLPNTYFVADNQQSIAAQKYQRRDFNLPEKSFVFCSFNRITKITAQEFDIWMQLLREVPNAVLWLYAKEQAQTNLKIEAEKRGVSPERLIFADELPKDKHLARMQLADFMLDSFRCNGHTTTIDALWAGIPVLTCMGYDIMSRAAASILKAMELPELIATDEKDYLRIALYYANHPKELKKLCNKVAEKKRTAPLFQTAQQVKNIEKAYLQAWENYIAGNEPKMIVVK